ncbi:nitrate reductase molybdenum cofactor assembly chaperone [Salininema proteolyticum]|uniref:Nitrate reductase molybdenum cofactor assembly chaperone n=1 Tax=Salininema proteolyticum TaxID=1607685 RepID=A0ABV8U348_9ACTN
MDEKHLRRLLDETGLLLAYPDDDVLEEYEGVRTPALADSARELRAIEPRDLRLHYTEIFDLRRKTCLYLTYFTDGDTRRRGAALAAFTATYRESGFDMRGGELPDFLPVVCEYAAHVDLGAGLRILTFYRASLLAMESALAGTPFAEDPERTTPYAPILSELCAALPEPTGRDRKLVAELVSSGPPTESVGV